MPDLIFDNYFDITKRELLIRIRDKYNDYLNENWVENNASHQWKIPKTSEEKNQMNKVSKPYYDQLIELFKRL
ncbi:hypothetical protein D3C77_791930 [compost metagenome]